jgi:hypothetical protein
MSHRYIGIGVSVALIMFSASAFIQTLSSSLQPDDRHQYMDKSPILVQNYNFSLDEALTQVENLQEWTIVNIGHQTYYRVQSAEQLVYYFHTQSGISLENGDDLYAKELALRFGAPENLVNISTQSQFGGEYGFINKRLPVIKLMYDDDANHTYYIETWTGYLAAKFNQSSRFYGLFFTFVHKWHFLDPIGRDVRDVIMVLFCLLISAVAASGIWIYLKKLKWN